MAIKRCVVCGGEFEVGKRPGLRGNRAVTCSDVCSQENSWRVCGYNPRRECRVCGAAFNSNGPGQTCSPSCRDEWRNDYDHKRGTYRGKATLKQCLICNGKFKSRGVKKTCSPKCTREKNLRRRPLALSKHCVVCNSIIPGYQGVKKACSPECATIQIAKKQRLKYREKNPIRTKQCVVCFSHFQVKANVKTCSPECGEVAKKERSVAYWCEKRSDPVVAERHRLRNLKYNEQNRDKINRMAREREAKRTAALQLLKEQLGTIPTLTFGDDHAPT